MCTSGWPFRISGLTRASSAASSSRVRSIPFLLSCNLVWYSLFAYSALYRYLSKRHDLDFEQLLHTYGARLSTLHGASTKSGHSSLHLRHSLHGILHLWPLFLWHTSRLLHVSLNLHRFGFWYWPKKACLGLWYRWPRISFEIVSGEHPITSAISLKLRCSLRPLWI